MYMGTATAAIAATITATTMTSTKVKPRCWCVSFLQVILNSSKLEWMR
jgi:hypothetical protein